MKRGPGQRAQPEQELAVEPVERAGRERVGGERADDPAIDRERAAEAVVDVVEARGGRAGRRGDQAIERIGQAGVGREPDRPVAGDDRGQAGMAGEREAHAEDLGREAVDRERDELVVAQGEERGGVARDGRADRLEQVLVAIGGAQRAGQVDSDLQEGGPVGVPRRHE